VNRQLVLKTILGTVAGLVLGATIMFAAEYFNTTLRSANEVSAATDAPMLGQVTTHRSARAARQDLLTVLAKPESTAADRFQRLGMHLQFSAIRDALHSLLITDISENVAAGETAANLAIVLARLGTNVVLVDADVHDTVITHQFGLAERAGLADYLVGDEVDIHRLVLKVADLPRLSVLPFGLARGDRFGLVTSPRLQEALAHLREASDLVIIAGPPLLENAGGFVLGSRVTRTLVIATSGHTSRDQLREVVEELRAVGAGVLGVLLAEPARRPIGGMPFNRRRPAVVGVDPSLAGARGQAARKTARS
jgi:Mrp family chromosome partitioning ATPase